MSAAVALVSLLKKNSDVSPRSQDDGPSSEAVLTLTQEARLLVKALQENDISEEELLRMVNTDISVIDENDPQRYNIIRRARRIFQHLDINQDGVIASDDLQEIKGRLYADAEASTDSLQKLRSGFKHNEEAVAALRDKATVFLTHREGYALCFLHLMLFACFASVLALQSFTDLEWEVRAVVSRAVFPEDIFGQDLTMINKLELGSKAEVLEWFEAAFVSDEDTVFADPPCGDGTCDKPLEHPVWRDSDNQDGCRVDCKAFARNTNTTLRRLAVTLTADDTLTTTQQGLIRWNLVCPSVTHYGQQLTYFDTDQALNVSSASTAADQEAEGSWTLYLFDCDWQLRVYAPQGGLGGSLVFAATGDNSTMVQNISLSEEGDLDLKLGSSPWLNSYSYTWQGCESPEPEQNDVLGDIYLCSDSPNVFINDTLFRNNAELLNAFETFTETYIMNLVSQELVSYTNLAPSCYCAGASQEDCEGDPCPENIAGTSMESCPLGCDISNDGNHVREICLDAGLGAAEGVTCSASPPISPTPMNGNTCVDCNGCDCSEYTEWLGDGFCDNGAAGLNFNCAEFNCDRDDCEDDDAGNCIVETTTSGVTESTEAESTEEEPAAFSTPCDYDIVEYDQEHIAESLHLKVSGFLFFQNEHPSCVVMQMKSRTDSVADRNFVRAKWEALATNSSNYLSALVERSVANMSATLNAPGLAIEVEEINEPPGSVCNLTANCLMAAASAKEIVEYSSSLGYDSNPCTLLSEVYGCQTDGCGCPYPTCNATGCAEPGKTCDDFAWTSCATLESMAGCDCSGCECVVGDDCPRACFGMTCEELVSLSEDEELGYFLESPSYLPDEFYPNFPFLQRETSFEWLESEYGCNCAGCSSGGGAGGGAPPGTRARRRRGLAETLSGAHQGVEQISEHESPEEKSQSTAEAVATALAQSERAKFQQVKVNVDDRRLQAIPREYYDYYAEERSSEYDPWEERGDSEDEGDDTSNSNDVVIDVGALAGEDACSPECTRSLLLNGVCDRVCATSTCNYDFYDCCVPTFVSSTKSLATPTDTTLLELSMDNDIGTPYESWDTQRPKRYVANKHRLVAGVLFDQTRAKTQSCKNSSNVADWAEVGIGKQVVQELTQDAQCPTSVNQITVAGSDPVFEPRSTLYNRYLDFDVCHPGGEDDSGFPFVRFPEMGSGKPLRWGRTMTDARNTSQTPGFFDLSQLTEDEESYVQGGYPLFFDCSFDYDRAITMIKYMSDGYYVHTDTTVLTVKFLLFKQDEEDDKPPLVTYVQVTFDVQDAGSIGMTKDITIFNPTPYDGSVHAVIRMLLELGFLLGIVLNIGQEIHQFVRACRQTGKPCAHLQDLWNLLDAATLLFQFATVFLWLECLTSLTENGFAPLLHYDVYDIDPNCPGANLARFNNTALTELRMLYESAEHYATMYTAYRGMCTVVFILMTFQLLHVLHFQPKLSLITRTMGQAWDDLTHLFMLFALVEFAFALLGHVIYGSTVGELSTLGDAFTTLLLALFGNFDFALTLGELYGFQGYLYYFLYMAVAFLLLMNMLLAILVDAYINVKEESDKADGVFTDMLGQGKAAARALRRPKGMMNNEDIVDLLDKWLDREEQDNVEVPTMPVSHQYNATQRDMQRLLHHYLQSEHALNNQLRGVIDPTSAEKEVDMISKALMFHYGEKPKAKNDDRVFPARSGTVRESTVEQLRNKLAEEKQAEGIEMMEKPDGNKAKSEVV